MATAQPTVVIVGPTASGKSALAMQLAKLYDGEIICADSRTVYEGMDIATAKPSSQDQRAAKHWCLDLVEPNQPFSVYDWQQAAKIALQDIRRRRKTPIIVGGSGLYIDAIVYDLQFSEIDKPKRKQLEELSTQKLISLASERFDEVFLTSDTIGNRRYLIRMLEGNRQPQSLEMRELPKDVILVGLNPPKLELEQRITQRIIQMISAGLLDETKNALNVNRGESRTTNAYQVLKDYLAGTESLDIAKEKLIIADRRLAKKQITWFKRDKNVIWFESAETCLEYVKQRLNRAS